MSSSIMRFKTPIKTRIIIGLSVMVFGIVLLLYTLIAKGGAAVDNVVVFVIIAIPLSWYLICSADRISVSIFSFLTFINIYISISYISDTLAIGFEGNAYVVARIIIRTIIYLIILPLLFKYVRGHFRKLVDTLDKEWQAAVLMPLLFLVLQSVVIYYPTPYWRWDSGCWLRVIISIVYMLFLAVYYLLYIQGNAIVDKYTLEKRQLIMNQQEKLLETELMQQKDIERKLKYISYHDSMTNLYNRTYINEIISNVVDDGTIVFIFDIDKLKHINDNFGHTEGDRLLQRFANVLKESFDEEKHIIARTGGDEFSVIISDSNEEKAAHYREKIIDLVNKDNRRHENRGLTLSASIGYALKQTDTDTVEDLMRIADEKMYLDKQRKSN
jgi:diguanylate cyclase (GGDEF)-like protein